MSSGDAMTSTPQKNESTFIKTVTLLDWWLVKSKVGRKTSVSVSGINSAQKQPVRVFSSAPIAKRFDVFTLETDDGVSIILKGIINTQKSIHNGFPTQACQFILSFSLSPSDFFCQQVVKKFSLGFPENWQQYALKTKRESPASDPLQNVKESPVPNKMKTRADRSKTRVAQNNDDKPKDVPQGDTKHKSPAGKGPKRKSAGTVRQNNDNTPRNKIKKNEEQATLRSQQAEKYVLSPESLSVGRSRSGRILLPTLEFWRNQVPVYEMDRTVSGIWEERSMPVPQRGSQSEPRKKRRQER